MSFFEFVGEVGLEQNLKSVLEGRTAGDPDDEERRWTDLSPIRIAEIVGSQGTPVSPHVVRDWLKDEGLALHKIEQNIAGGSSPDRDAQFHRIDELPEAYFLIWVEPARAFSSIHLGRSSD